MSTLRDLGDWYGKVIEITAKIAGFPLPKFIGKVESMDIKTNKLLIAIRKPADTLFCPVTLPVIEDDLIKQEKTITYLKDIIALNKVTNEKRYIDHAFYLQWIERLNFKKNDLVKLDVIVENYLYKNGQSYNYCFRPYNFPRYMSPDQLRMYSYDVDIMGK